MQTIFFQGFNTLCKLTEIGFDILCKLFPSQKIGLDILCYLSPMDTICMNCQILFSGENKKKKYLKLSSAEIFTQHAKH